MTSKGFLVPVEYILCACSDIIFGVSISTLIYWKIIFNVINFQFCILVLLVSTCRLFFLCRLLNLISGDESLVLLLTVTAEKMKFFIKDFFIFCAVCNVYSSGMCIIALSSEMLNSIILFCKQSESCSFDF